MATNEILPFAETDTGTNLLTQVEYDGDAQRPIGNQPGVARSKLVNKVLRQTSLIASAIGKFVADRQSSNVVDSDSEVVTAAKIGRAFQSGKICFASAGGSENAIVGTFDPTVSDLSDGMVLYLRANASNTATNPTFTPNAGVIPVKTIEKGNGILLEPGDISGPGHMLALQFDMTNDRWKLLNPAIPTVTITTSNDASFADSSKKPASTGWVRGAMSAIAVAAGFSISINSSGYVKFPSWLGGIIFQWVQATGTSLVTANWPIAYPTACRIVFTAVIDALVFSYVSNYTATQVDIGHNKGSSGTVYAFSIGN